MARRRRFSYGSAPRNLRAVYAAYGGRVAEIFDIAARNETKEGSIP